MGDPGSLGALLGRFGTLSDALGTVPGRSRDVPRTTWDAPRKPQDVPKTLLRAFGASFSRDLGEKACRKARRAIFERFCVARVVSRDSADVHDTSVLMGPKHNGSMFAARERTHARASKKQDFWPRKSSLGGRKRASSSAKTVRSSEKARPKCLRGFRKFISGCERGNFERASATASGPGRADLRASRTRISESSNGFGFV